MKLAFQEKSHTSPTPRKKGLPHSAINPEIIGMPVEHLYLLKFGCEIPLSGGKIRTCGLRIRSERIFGFLTSKNQYNISLDNESKYVNSICNRQNVLLINTLVRN